MVSSAPVPAVVGTVTSGATFGRYPPGIAQIIENRRVVGDGDADGLARIHHRSAAEGEHPVAAVLAIRFRRRLDPGDGRVGRNAVEHGRLDVGGERVEDALHHTVLDQAPVAQQQRAPDAEPGKLAADGAYGAEIEQHARIGKEFGHGDLSPLGER